ncbi:unnamed protein product [Notodromas monacha]|uniref:Uncharacterized protein n=1 Tax=Notodromas monacha TaxID=399045 RepID=A0A7R9BRA7_9CRUS|nr:unnamed protein product [Notodromas monacha]CAG0918874.1 unnamed protein product [Notodromas monacha]
MKRANRSETVKVIVEFHFSSFQKYSKIMNEFDSMTRGNDGLLRQKNQSISRFRNKCIKRSLITFIKKSLICAASIIIITRIIEMLASRKNLPYFHTKESLNERFFKVHELPKPNPVDILPNQIMLFDHSGKLELSAVTACVLESLAFNNFNRDVYLFLDQSTVTWKRIYADILLSMPNFKVLRAPDTDFLAQVADEDFRRLIDHHHRQGFHLTAKIRDWAILHEFGGIMTSIDLIAHRQFEWNMRNFIVCRESNGTCQLAPASATGFLRRHELLRFMIESALQVTDSESNANWQMDRLLVDACQQHELLRFMIESALQVTDSESNANWQMDRLLVDACQQQVNAGKFDSMENCTKALDVSVVFESRLVVNVDDGNRKEYFNDERAEKTLSDLAESGAYFLTCSHKRCKQEEWTIVEGCHALGRFMQVSCPKVKFALELERLCRDPWGIFGRYVPIEVLPFCQT